MCGIVAIVNRSGQGVDLEELTEITDSMASRGPDGSGVWISPGSEVGLGHRRLSLVDLSEAGAQPMPTQDGSLRIVFNGEIYNYQELRHRLEGKGVIFHSDSDTEVLLHLYAEKGERMVEDLRGMYAFVIWEERRQRIFAARDPLGIKPLYYSDDGASIRIASQVKALIHSKQITLERDSAGQIGFLLLGYIPEPFTMYRAVKALPAGSYLTADLHGHLSIYPFCRIEDELAAACNEKYHSSPAPKHERLYEALFDSVRCHMIADVPVGVFLSAGLDSAVLTALAAELPNSRLNTITLGFKEYRGSGKDETQHSSIVAKQYGTSHKTRWVCREEFESDFANVLTAMDQPSIDGVNTYFVAKAAHEVGLKAALSGVGGDELFGGYPSFVQIPRIYRQMRRTSFGWFGRALRKVSAPVLSQFTSSKWAGLLEYGNTWSGAYLLRRALFMPWEMSRVLAHDIARDGWERLEIRSRLEETVRGIESPALKVAALEIVWYMRNQLLRDSDWAGMAHSVEIRTPLADIKVLRAIAPFAARGELRSHKGDLAVLPSRPLPHSLTQRGKTGFETPIQNWISPVNGKVAGRGLRGWAIRLAAEASFDLSPSLTNR